MKWLLAIFVLAVAGCSAESDIATEGDVTTEGEVTTNSIGMKLKLIPAGDFMMGSDVDIAENQAHQVTLTKPFMLGVYEVTQEQYEKVMGVNPSLFQGQQNPVENMDWHEAVAFCSKLSERPAEKAAGRFYRLPTEAEWEYACRAGTTTTYSFGDDESQLGDYEWFGDNSGGTTHAVGGKKPNSWGLFDMHGNVSEWCQDWYGDYSSFAVTDPEGAASGPGRVTRGGDWGDIAALCWLVTRGYCGPSGRSPLIGFRVACVTSGQSSK